MGVGGVWNPFTVPPYECVLMQYVCTGITCLYTQVYPETSEDIFRIKEYRAKH